jgi:hypothetical protein
MRCNKIRALTTDVKDIHGALRDSDVLSVTEDGTKVFRTTPVKEKNNTDECTIYVVSVVFLSFMSSVLKLSTPPFVLPLCDLI